MLTRRKEAEVSTEIEIETEIEKEAKIRLLKVGRAAEVRKTRGIVGRVAEVVVTIRVKVAKGVRVLIAIDPNDAVAVMTDDEAGTEFLIYSTSY